MRLLAFGAGEAIGQLWLTLLDENDQHVYFQLDEAPASGSTSLGGYIVLARGISVTRSYDFGYGGFVAVIGNDTDAFIVSTTGWSVPVTRDSLGYQIRTFEPVMTVADISGVRTDGSGNIVVAFQIATPDGTVIDELHLTAEPAGGVTCRGATQYAVDVAQTPMVLAIEDAAMSLGDWLLESSSNVGAGMALATVLTATKSKTASAAAGMAVLGIGEVAQVLSEASHELSRYVAETIAVEGLTLMCQMEKNRRGIGPSPAIAPGTIPGENYGETGHWEFYDKCIEWATETARVVDGSDGSVIENFGGESWCSKTETAARWVPD